MIPVFKVQIIDAYNERIMSYYGGEKAEIDLFERICEKLDSKPVGFFRTRSKVKECVAEALHEVLTDLKNSTLRIAQSDTSNGR